MSLITTAKQDLVINAENCQHPSSLMVARDTNFEQRADGCFYYGYVLDGECNLQSSSVSSSMHEGTYFSVNSPFAIKASGTVVLMKRFGYKGLNSMGGPIEEKGRQAYIDGCTSTLLLGPARLGDPCLNFLHFPPNIVQSNHNHPSIRLGVVVRGKGFCHLEGKVVPLQKGDCFLLDENEKHHFSSEELELDVIAYHPDSDWGPTDEVHPMLNRTFLIK